MKLEIGKHYITRDGTVVGPIEKNPGYDYPGQPFSAVISGLSAQFNSDGSFHEDRMTCHLDLISEYKQMKTGYKYYTDNADLRKFLQDQCRKLGIKISGTMDSLKVGVYLNPMNNDFGGFSGLSLIAFNKVDGCEIETCQSVDEFLAKAKEFAKKTVTVQLNDKYTATWDGGDMVTVGCQSIPLEKVLELAEKIKQTQK